MINSIPNFLLSIDDTQDSENVYDTSYVSNPATRKSFLLFEDATEKNTKQAFKAVDGYERMTSGVWMMPDTKYIRRNESGLMYTVEFTKDTLKEALLKYLKSNHGNNVTLEHGEDLLEGFVAVEHWIIEDENTKSPVFGLSLTDLGYNPAEIPQGTVMKTTYVADETFWNEQVLTGNVSGYSISGLFNLQKFNEQVTQVVIAESNISKLFKEMGVIAESGNLLLNDGQVLTIGGESIVIDGEYTLTNGLTLVMKDNQLVDYGKSTPSESFNDATVVAEVINPVEVVTEVEVTPEVIETEVPSDVTETQEVVESAVSIEAPITVEPSANEITMEQMQAQLNELHEQMSKLMEELDAKDEQIANMTKVLDKQPIKSTTVPTSTLKNHNETKPTGTT